MRSERIPLPGSLAGPLLPESAWLSPGDNVGRAPGSPGISWSDGRLHCCWEQLWSGAGRGWLEQVVFSLGCVGWKGASGQAAYAPLRSPLHVRTRVVLHSCLGVFVCFTVVIPRLKKKIGGTSGTSGLGFTSVSVAKRKGTCKAGLGGSPGAWPRGADFGCWCVRPGGLVFSGATHPVTSPLP